MDPGDQKVFGPTAFGSSSSRHANRIYAAILFLIAAAGVAWAFIEEWITGVIMTLGGVAGMILFLLPEVRERRMVRRMQERTTSAAAEKGANT